ncbi:MAG: haloacid dehalogenase type II [Alphaproteobacteria bacterium]
MGFKDFEALSFDCYGTLIDWESGIWNALQPWMLRTRCTADRETALVAFANAESSGQRETPAKLYSHLLADIFPALTASLGTPGTADEALAFGSSVGAWPAFPDSAAALARLKQRYKLVILSNVDVAGFCQSAKRLETPFDYVFTAQEIGSYKPNPDNFAYMTRQLASAGLAHGKVLHVAQSLFHDHQEATRQGFATCWINRRQGDGWGATKEIGDLPKTDWEFPTMAAFADAVDGEV